jgi:Tfp pilus assembly protein PilN
LTTQEQKAVRLKEEVKQLRQKIRPLEQDWEKLKKTKDFYKSMDEFLKTRPQMYSQINEIARLSPEGTWFSRFTFQGDEMTLQGQGPDGLKVIESIRTSTLFEQVKLIGSVSRSPSGVEQFSISVKLEKEEPVHP